MHAETLPPYRHVSSRPITLENASAMLSTYLKNSESYAHLHPDALITPSGTTFSAQGGPMGGVVMHNLRRVAAGLRGDYLEPEPTPEPEDGEGQTRTTLNDAQNDSTGKQTAAATEEGWQDMSEFEREEGMIEVGEVGERSNFVQEGGEAPELQAVGGAEQLEGEGKKRRKEEEEGKLDKEARKKAKKAKDKEFRAKKEKARAEKSA